MAAPGVRMEHVDLVRPGLSRLRSDVAGFLGYAERGPLGLPVRLTSWRQFLEAFGPPLSPGHTGEAVRLFFENGGEICYMQRIADVESPRGAAASGLTLAFGAAKFRLRAGFSSIAPPQAEGFGPIAAPAEAGRLSPGVWGDRLTLSLSRGVRAATETRGPQAPESFRVARLAGFLPGDWASLSQDGRAGRRFWRIRALDPAAREILWERPVSEADLDLARPLRIEAQAFSLETALDGLALERLEELSPDPDHPRYAPRVFAEASRLLLCEAEGAADLSDPEAWPASAPGLPFRGGRDGLAGVGVAHFLEGLLRFERVEEIALLAAPDLVLVAEPPAPPAVLDLPDRPCLRMEAPPAGRLAGRLLDAETGAPLSGVRVEAVGRSLAARTGADGRFLLEGLTPGQADLRFRKAGFAPLEAGARISALRTSEAADFTLTPLLPPPAFSEDEVFVVQEAMAAQGEKGLRRVALLDPPVWAAADPEAALDWRARFDSSHAALYWPWLRAIRPDGGLALEPPSGAVAGLIARMDLAEGRHRAPANRPLRAIAGLAAAVSPPLHAALNERGVNVLRADPGRGVAPQGARTLSSDPELRFLNVRRLLLAIAKAVEDGHQWAVFEPNDRLLRAAVTQSLTGFLSGLWRQGVFAGARPEAAFAVKCDEENNPPSVTDRGMLVAQIAVAPSRPYEFIRLRLGRTERLIVQTE